MFKLCGSCRAVVILYKDSKEVKEYHCQNRKKWGQRLDDKTKLDTDIDDNPMQNCSDKHEAAKELRAKNFVTFGKVEEGDEVR